MLDLYVTPIAEGFESRALKLEGFDTLNYYVLSVEDLIVSKLGRYSDKDKEDISKLIIKAEKSLLLELIQNVQNRLDFSARVKVHFIEHVLLFRETYHV